MKPTFLTVVSTLFMSATLLAQERSAQQLLPDTTVLFAEIPNPPELIAAIFDHPLRQKIEALEPYKQAIRSEGYRGFLAGRKFVEIQLGMEWREALESLTAKGVHLGVDNATGGLAVLVQAKDAKSLDLFLSKFLTITKLGQNPDSIKEGDYRGVTAYEMNTAKFAVVDDWLLITNKSETGQAVLDRLIGGPAKSLADQPRFLAASTARAANTAWAFADLETLRDAGAAKNLFAGRSNNPGIELLVGGILDVLQETTVATAAFNATIEGLSLSFSIPSRDEWVSEEREFFFGPEQSGKGPALPAVAETLFTLSAYRDVSEMWLRAGDLFDENINDGIAEADANLTTFFSGKDFGEDILGALTPEIGFMATKQNFADILPIPTIKLPQFALVMDLREPETMTRELKRTFQSMIGFFNVIGAMEGRPQLEMDILKLDNGAQLVTSTYIPEKGEEQSTDAPILFNFSPSVGFAGQRFVVASTDRLAKELVTAQTTSDHPMVNTAIALDAGVLQAVLDENRNQLISQNMLSEGNSREEAEFAIGLLLELVGYFRDASINLKSEDDQLLLQFGIQFKSE